MIRSVPRWLLGIVYILWAGTFATAQDITDRDFVVTQYGMEEGLPQSTVNDLIQSRSGYIWIATNGGLVRFDGNDFTTFNRSNSPNMHYDRIIKIYEDREGVLWVTSENGLLRLKNGEFKPYVFNKGSIRVSPRDIKEDENGILWATIFNDVYKYVEEEFIKVPPSNDPELVQKAKNSTSGVWLVTKKHLYKTIDDSVVLIKNFDDIVSSELISITEFPSGSGTLFIGTMSNGIAKYENEQLTFFNNTNGLPSNNFINFKKDRRGNLFTQVFGAMAIWNGTNFERFKPFENSGDIRFQQIIEDNEGNYWVGTAANGLFKLSRSIIEMIDEDDGLKNDKMLALMQTNDGSVLLSTNCGGIYHWKDGQLSIPENDFIAEDGCFWSMHQDSQGRYWFGARGVYMTESLDEPGTFLGGEEGFSAAEVFAITEDRRGNMWIATSDFLAIYNEGIIRRYTTDDGLYYNDARTLYEDEDGTMWVGTGQGLNKIKNGIVSKVELLVTENDEPIILQPYVRAIHKDSEGVMWVGTYGHGIFRIKDGNIDNVTTAQGLFDNIVSHIIEDENEYFWMGSNRGISRVSKSDLNAVIAGDIDEVRAFSYGTVDGMNSAETNGGFQPSAFMDSLGQIYFPTVAGVAVVSSVSADVNEVPPPVYLESIRTSRSVLTGTDSISIPYNTPYLQVQYTALNFTDPNKVEFKHRIKGLNDDWIEVGGSREAIFSSIPPGEYTFQVIASNGDGIWNEEGASMAITVIPPFWQETWFIIITAIFILSVGFSLNYVRVRNLKKENERKRRFAEKLIDSQEKERRRIASELHDGLGQQILVIKNRAELAQKQADEPNEILVQLKEIMQSAVTSIGDVRNISHNLRPVHLEKFGVTEAIENLCEQLKRTSSIDWSYHIDDIDGMIPEEKEINFYRIVQEATTNIQKHSSASEASVMVRVTEQEIQALIWDDGEGFDKSLLDMEKGLGFSGMYERAETLKGAISVDSEPGQGTTVKIIIPI